MNSDTSQQPMGHPHAGIGLTEEQRKELLAARAAGKVEGQQANGRRWVLNPPFQPDVPRYPLVGSHLWNAWPIFAIETGGYCDLEVTIPGTGQVFTDLDAYRCDEHAGTSATCHACHEITTYDALRHLIDAMEAAKLLDAPEE